MASPFRFAARPHTLSETGYSTPYLQGDNVGTYNITGTSGSLASALGYGFSGATLSGGLTVHPATLVAAAADKTRTYGSNNPTLTLTLTGLKNGDSGSVFSGYTLSTLAGLTSPIGAYAINVSGGSAGPNYTVVRQDGMLTIAALTLPPSVINSVANFAATTPGIHAASYGGQNSPINGLCDCLENAPASECISGQSPSGKSGDTASDGIKAR